MKKIILASLFIALCAPAFAAQKGEQVESKNIALNPAQTKKGKPVMQALAERKSVRSFDSKELDLQTLSNLLWAAVGVSRPDGKRTAPTAMDRREVDVYACLKGNAYHYNAPEHRLDFVAAGDCSQNGAPVTLLLVADSAKNNERWAAADTGMVSQNISLFCAGMGLATVPRGQMPAAEFSKLLGLKKSQILLLNHPVGYPRMAGKKE